MLLLLAEIQPNSDYKIHAVGLGQRMRTHVEALPFLDFFLEELQQ